MSNTLATREEGRVLPRGGGDYQRIEVAIRFIIARVDSQPSLDEVAEHLGLSATHCHRLFHRWAGLTPKDFLQAITLERAKETLRSGPSVLQAALSAGLSGAGRLHDLFLTLEGMTPGDYRRAGAGLEILWARFETPLGPALFAQTERGLCAVRFLLAEEHLDEAAEELAARWPGARLRHDPAALRTSAAAVVGRMRGEATRPLAVLLKGTNFQIQVWRALLAIPAGQVATYGQLASALGYPKAQRAVGTAIGANPIGYLIPCHRVLRSAGVIGGYRWGTERKRAALALDARPLARA